MIKKSLLVACVGVFALGACSEDTKQNLGLKTVAPDEFSVVTRAPLSVPPDYSLRPPRPGATRPMEQTTADTARQTVFGVSDVNQQGIARIEGDAQNTGFLDKIGATNANPNIRDVVDQERLQGVEDNRSTAQKLLMMDGDPEDQGTPIDPKEELDRLQQEGVVTIKKRNEDIEAP